MITMDDIDTERKTHEVDSFTEQTAFDISERFAPDTWDGIVRLLQEKLRRQYIEWVVEKK